MLAFLLSALLIQTLYRDDRQKNFPLYRDFRFWLVVGCLGVLVVESL